VKKIEASTSINSLGELLEEFFAFNGIGWPAAIWLSILFMLCWASFALWLIEGTNQRRCDFHVYHSLSFEILCGARESCFNHGGSSKKGSSNDTDFPERGVVEGLKRSMFYQMQSFLGPCLRVHAPTLV
jgi:hypothetical protein